MFTNKKTGVFITLLFLVPPAEFESAAFCSASKRSIQLSYEGVENIVRIKYTAAH